ncbi:MAG: hypothetical protein EXQ86_03735 [Rhodospirillales bacterium]|nr:hypothetical protein [Rhodospirillales bacterium]
MWEARAFACGMALWLAGLSAGSAAEPSIKLAEPNLIPGYQSYVDLLASHILAGAAAGGGNGPAVYFDLNRPLSEASGFDGLAAADQSLMRAAKQTYDLHRALGGSPIGQAALIQRRDGRYYVGLDGAGGRWLATPQEALGHLANQLTGQPIYRLPSTKSTISCPFHFECLLLGTYIDVPIVAFVPRATTVTLELTADGFAQGTGGVVVLVPEGFTVHQVTRTGGDRIQALVSIGPAAVLGVNIIHAFNEGRAFRPVASYGVHVTASPEELQALVSDGAGTSAPPPPALPGTGQVLALTDDFGNDAATAVVLSGPTAGRIEVADDIDLFRVVVTQGGTLVVTSSGGTDVKASLESMDGAVIAADDDGGPWYNFRVESSVAPGTYVVRVAHCCRGTGRYGISFTLSP